jgi:hypothetical protein
MSASQDPAAQRYGLTAKRGPGLILVAATSVVGSLVGCGDVTAIADAATSGSDAPANLCGPNPCLLSDDFGGAMLNLSTWGFAVSGGGTISQSNGVLTLRLPAVANAYADVYSLVGFPAGTSFEASVTFSAGQFYDHKGAGFASARIGSGCDQGETDAAMFRGQDGDGYVETKVSGGTSTCTLTTKMYPGSVTKMQIARLADQVVFRQDNTSLAPVTTNVPMGLLPVRFSAYTFTTAPMAPVQISVDYVRVSRP